MIELSNSKTIYLGTNAEGRHRWSLDASIAAIQFRENGGAWQDIDPSIEAPDTGGFSVKFTQVPYLGRIGDDSHRRIYPDRTDLTCWIQFEKPFASMPMPTRMDRWFYWDFPNALMGIRFDNMSIKFGFRLKNASAPTSITIPFTTQGITRQGRLLYHNGEIIGELRKPTAIDANGEERDCGISFGTGEVTISLDTTGLTFPIDIDPTLNLQVGASNDDITVNKTSSSVHLTPVATPSGRNASDEYIGCGLRFTGVTVPKSATIGTAYITLTSKNNLATNTVNSKISAEDVDNPGNFAGETYPSFMVRYGNKTTAVVNWDSIVAFVANNEYDSPEIKTVIQEIVSRAGWSSGNAIVIFWEDFDERSTATSAYRDGYSYDGSSSKAAKLHIEYTTGGAQASEPMGAKMIAGKLI